MSAMAVELRGVGHRYGAQQALAEVALGLPAGSSLGLIGPDGVGKSTLLGLIAGVKRIQQGQVRVLGGDMADAGHRRRICQRIAYMPQGLGRNLYPTLSVAENVDFFGRLFGHDAAARRERSAELLAATGLLPFAERAAGKLSGGMKQKLGLCCALIHDPELLILDEPTTGVDPLSRRQFWELIARIRARQPGMTLLVATSYMAEAEPLDTLLAMDGGRVLATGSPAELKARTGAATLEEAFIGLLPQARRRDHRRFSLPPRPEHGSAVAIEAQDLTRRFGDFVAVDGVSLRIERGEIFGFLGSNGCGKTTTMKMLTGLLPASAGAARLLGRPVDARDLAMRRRVGYMSQSFSLYGELSVRQNLALHARLFHLPEAEVDGRVAELVAEFGLEGVLHERAERLPLGLRQRLSLAVAVIHRPELLILDEPTSGVDPVARDQFWQLLSRLSRQQGVTIFISTHFMNEAERCDRISLMHAGRVLAQGSPAELVARCGVESLEEAFIAYLEEANGEGVVESPLPVTGQECSPHSNPPLPAGEGNGRPFSTRRLWAYARREALELRRDPIRLGFALLGTLLLMVVFGFGISFDVEHLPYAVLDRDDSLDSRAYREEFAGSRYFAERPAPRDAADAGRRLQSGELRLVIEIPPDFGRDLRAGRIPEVAVWLDGAMPFRGETARGYVEGVHQSFLAELARRALGEVPQTVPARIETRYRYNQAFQSVNAIVPGVVMLLLALIPAMLTAVGVVREKELGSILNFYATPTTRLEFLLGKQLPYIGVALLNFFGMLLLALLLFQVPVKGSFAALALGALLYVTATTAFGLLISSFVATQVAALFATAILTTLPAVNFSGLIVPLASLTGAGRLMGAGFPSAYFQRISVGAFGKGLGFAELWPQHLMLALFAVLLLSLSVALMRGQER